MHFDPLASTISAYDSMAAGYSKEWFESDSVTDFVEKFIQTLPDKATVLDAGCGSGREINKLTQSGFDCIGIDLSPATISMARLNVPEAYFRVMDFRQIDYPDSLFEGALCVASVHHLFNEDFQIALKSFRRVIRPGGTLGLTIKLGAGYEYDRAGRFNYFRDREKSLSAISDAGFDMQFEEVSKGSQNQSWLQVIARSNKRPPEKPSGEVAEGSSPVCSFCQSPFFMFENFSSGLPVAASIMWGDGDYFVAVDRAPLTEGHLLICSNPHVLSMYGNNMPLDSLVEHKDAVASLLYETYKRQPLFLEHGMDIGTTNKNPCIEHAHIMVVARDLKDDEFHWRSVADQKPVKERFRKTLATLTERLDKEISERHIFSNVPEAVKNRLSRAHLPTMSIGRSQAARNVLGDLARHLGSKSEDVEKKTLGDLGEDCITNQIISKIFEHGRRGASFIGDDAAVIPWKKTQSLAISTDPCPTPVFFQIGEKNYRAHGWLAAVISLSDMAATGARPTSMLLDCEMPEDMIVGNFLDLLDGIKYAAGAYRFDIIGGNIREAQKLRVSTTVLGETIGRRGFRRSDASPGEGVYVVGEMGHFWAAVIERLESDLLPADAHAELAKALYYPDPQVNTSLLLASANLVGACMDASDGPTRCFEEIARQSNVDIEIDWNALKPSQPVEIVGKRSGIDPRLIMLTWGNFELVFTADDEELERRFSGTDFFQTLRRVGVVKKGAGKAKLKKSNELVSIPDLSSYRFQKNTSLLGGVESYFKILREMQV